MPIPTRQTLTKDSSTKPLINFPFCSTIHFFASYLHVYKGICMLVYMYTLFIQTFDTRKNIHFYVLLQHLDIQACIIYIQINKHAYTYEKSASNTLSQSLQHLDIQPCIYTQEKCQQHSFSIFFHYLLFFVNNI